uniref:hypothetical protein n=1 Tax=Flavobacterium sp. TaxID=239 RepID=UPI004049981C
MKENPKHIIPNPCHKRWENMQKMQTPEFKNCQNCSKKVYDLRLKSKSEIDIWYKKSDENVCVIATENQLNLNLNNNKSIFDLRSFGIASVLIGSWLLQPNLYAQESKKADSFVMEQTNLKSEIITIEGIVKVKRFIGWKKLKEFNINIYSNETLVHEILVDKRGKFKIELNRKYFSEKMSMSIHAFGYKSLRIENIEIKDTMFKVFLDKAKMRMVVGRYF